MLSAWINGKRPEVRTNVRKFLRRARVTAQLAGDSQSIDQTDWLRRALMFTRRWPQSPQGVAERVPNRLREFSDARREGHGIWKWDHYFDIYHRHFERFRGTEVHLVEIGIYSGGSLEMWKDYFGPKCRIFGVDIQPSCKAYEDERVKVFIGDQADRDFWRRFRGEVRHVDIVIDDGGHAVGQQVVTLEELLPHLRPGGVFVCEDVHGDHNKFGGYAAGLMQALNAADLKLDFVNPDRRLASPASTFQASIQSIHSYPYVTVIEKRHAPLAEFVAPKRGTQWQPFMR